MNEPVEPPAPPAETPLAAEGDPAPLAAPAELSRPVSTAPSSARDFLARIGLSGKAPALLTADGTLIERPTFLFFGVVAGVSLLADVTTKAWAEIVLSKRAFSMDPGIVLVQKHLTLTLAYNEGGAWGLLSDASETIRRPFFFAVSVLAVLFIVSLYSKLVKGQHSLTWGLP